MYLNTSVVRWKSSSWWRNSLYHHCSLFRCCSNNKTTQLKNCTFLSTYISVYTYILYITLLYTCRHIFSECYTSYLSQYGTEKNTKYSKVCLSPVNCKCKIISKCTLSVGFGYNCRLPYLKKRIRKIHRDSLLVLPNYSGLAIYSTHNCNLI